MAIQKLEIEILSDGKEKRDSFEARITSNISNGYGYISIELSSRGDNAQEAVNNLKLLTKSHNFINIESIDFSMQPIKRNYLEDLAMAKKLNHER